MSSKHWMLQTQGHTLWHIQTFLADVYAQAGLDGMLVPLRMESPDSVETTIITDPTALSQADPFAPLMTVNTSKMAMKYLKEHPGHQLGLVMRPCEIRAVLELARRQAVNLQNLTIIGVDCAGTFTEKDFEWRGGVNKLAYEMPQYTRQGGIATYRYRPACQMCNATLPSETHLSIHVLGLPARKAVLIEARDDRIVEALSLSEITNGPATSEIIDQHQRVQKLLDQRREQARTRITLALDDEYAMDISTLIDHLKTCEICQEALDACPIYGIAMAEYDEEQRYAPPAVTNWLTSCAGCGMCEEACADHMPLARIFSRIREELETQTV